MTQLSVISLQTLYGNILGKRALEWETILTLKDYSLYAQPLFEDAT